MKRNKIKSRIAISLYRKWGRVPTREEINKYTDLAEILVWSITGAVAERSKQRKEKQLRLY